MPRTEIWRTDQISETAPGLLHQYFAHHGMAPFNVGRVPVNFQEAVPDSFPDNKVDALVG
jgi:hypothetical protein